jgi:hypothetical protein
MRTRVMDVAASLRSLASSCTTRSIGVYSSTITIYRTLFRHKDSPIFTVDALVSSFIGLYAWSEQTSHSGYLLREHSKCSDLWRILELRESVSYVSWSRYALDLCGLDGQGAYVSLHREQIGLRLSGSRWPDGGCVRSCSTFVQPQRPSLK